MASADRPRFVPPSSATESRTLLDRAIDLLNQGNLQESEAEYKKVIALSVHRSEGLYGLGVIELKRGNYATAATLFQSCLQLDPKNANAYYYLGESWEKQNEHKAATAFFEKALAINPSHRGALQKLKSGREAPGSIHEFRGPNAVPSESPKLAVPLMGVAGGFYDYLRADPSPLAKQTLQLLDSMTFTSVTPRLSAAALPIVLFALAGILVLWGAHSLATSLSHIVYGVKTGLVVNNFRTFAQYIIELLGLLLLAKSLVIALRMETTKYTFDKGRLQISKGIFSKKQENIELYRVEDIELHQTFFNRLTQDGGLMLHVTPGHGRNKEVELLGLVKVDQLQVLFDQLRNLILLLRTGAWGKGVIY